MKRLYFPIIFVWLLFSCELDKEFDYSSNEEQIVVNSLLCPDSIISVQLSRTLPYPNIDSIFPVVENASIKLFENGIFKGDLLYEPEKKAYFLYEYPEAGNTYSIQVEVPGHSAISASTSIPEMTGITACYAPFTVDEVPFKNKIYASVSFQQIKKEDKYWLGAVSDYAPIVYMDKDPFVYYDSTEVNRRWLVSLISGSAALDNFNSRSDKGLTSYSFYARINESTADVKDLNFDLFSFETSYFYTYPNIRDLPSFLGLYVAVFNGSPEFDHYLKSTVLYFLNSNFENTTPNPFVEQIITYSNIENGTGIFAGYNQQLLPLHYNPCK